MDQSKNVTYIPPLGTFKRVESVGDGGVGVILKDNAIPVDVVGASLLVPRARLKIRPTDGNERARVLFLFFTKGRAAKGKMSLGRCERQQKGGGESSLARRLLVLIKLSNPGKVTETEKR